MICWRVIRIVTGKEAVVNRALLRRNLETYLPMEVRSYRPSKHTKRRVCMEVPLIPRVLFAALPVEAPSLSKHRYVTGLQRDVTGELVTIPQRQMVSFMTAHQTWLCEQREKHRAGQAVKATKKKRSMSWEEGLKEIMKDLFNVDVDESKMESAA